MHYRNLAALDTEAMLTAQPMDAAVLIGGCDKTVPAQLMAAASADFLPCNWSPALCLPRLSRESVCPHVRLPSILGSISRRARQRRTDRPRSKAGWRHGWHLRRDGHRETMACIAETLGNDAPGPGPFRRSTPTGCAQPRNAGALAVKLISAPIRPSEIITATSVQNALRVLLALGGSTNALIHLTAIAGRRGCAST